MMFGFSWLKIGAGLAIIAFMAGFWLYIHNLQVKAANAEILAQQNKENALAFQDFKKQTESIIAALQAQHAQDTMRQAHTAKQHKDIANAKPSEDGPVAPVLARTLDGLRGSPDHQ